MSAFNRHDKPFTGYVEAVFYFRNKSAPTLNRSFLEVSFFGNNAPKKLQPQKLTNAGFVEAND